MFGCKQNKIHLVEEGIELETHLVPFDGKVKITEIVW